MSEQLHRDIGQSTIGDGGNNHSDCSNGNNAWNATVSSGAVANNNKNNNYFLVRPVSATTPVVYDIPFSSIIRAWLDCEQNKRTANSCTKFRWHAARDLVELWQEMREARYKPKSSMVFMVAYPVLREVWAGGFRDRVAHHWEHLRYQPILEQYFIDAGDRSMNCRKGYGSLRAVETFSKALYDFTEGYTRDDCYIVGGDFANFFMSADKPLIWPLLEELMVQGYGDADLPALLYMMRTTMFHRCQDNYFRRSPECMWEGLPRRKSLFYSDGMPIGNLPSQNWMNFVGAIATIYAVYKMKLAGFIIFVDDWRGLVRTLEEGRKVIAEFRQFLQDELHITLHPDKIYLQHYTKGTKFVGAVIKPGRVYVSNRTRGQFISKMMSLNDRGRTHKERVAMLDEVRASINSYLGLMCHYRSYNVRRRIIEEHILPTWGKYLYFADGYKVCKVRKEYDRLRTLRRRLKNRTFAAKFIRPKYKVG